MFIFDNVSNKQEKNTPKDHACQGICYTFVEKYNFPKELYIRVQNKKNGQDRLCLHFLPGTNNAPEPFARKRVPGQIAENKYVAN